MKKEEIYFTPIGVKVKNQDIESALKKFKNIVKDSKILFLYKEKQQFEKPSAKKRKKKFRGFSRTKKDENF
jgi:ribosomal protein S21